MERLDVPGGCRPSSIAGSGSGPIQHVPLAPRRLIAHGRFPVAFGGASRHVGVTVGHGGPIDKRRRGGGRRCRLMANPAKRCSQRVGFRSAYTTDPVSIPMPFERRPVDAT
jgi:hypothetical protein